MRLETESIFSQSQVCSEILQDIYSSLYLIRRVEEEIIKFYPTDKIKSPVHLSIGQEFISVAICSLLQKKDTVFGTYRGHALYLAKGGNLKSMIAELYGKESGCAQGKGGSMHLVDLSVNMMRTSAIVATSIPNAVGYALSLKIRKSPQIVVCFFGDGAVEEGVFYESINFAVIKKLPILFVCENNKYAIYTHINKRAAEENVCKRVAGLGIKAYQESSGDLFKIRDLSQKLIDEIKKGEGPFFLEVACYRWRDHVGPGEDWDLQYRFPQEMKKWIENDQLKAVGDCLDKECKEAIEKEVEQNIKEAFEFADGSSFPKLQEIYTDVYCEKQL